MFSDREGKLFSKGIKNTVTLRKSGSLYAKAVKRSICIIDNKNLLVLSTTDYPTKVTFLAAGVRTF